MTHRMYILSYDKVDMYSESVMKEKH